MRDSGRSGCYSKLVLNQIDIWSNFRTGGTCLSAGNEGAILQGVFQSPWLILRSEIWSDSKKNLTVPFSVGMRLCCQSIYED